MALGCRSEEAPITATGVRLAIEYDSSLDVDAFTVFAVDADGAIAVEAVDFDAPLFLEPPGVRLASVVLDTPSDEQDLEIRVDATSNDRLVGSGLASVTVRPDALVDATVRLGAPSTCGDGRLHSALEFCDDGNVDDGDGCTGRCVAEPGYVCRGVPSVCVECGNREVESGETCDDGNRTDGDGCSARCELEPDESIDVVQVDRLDPFFGESPEFTPVEGSELVFTPRADEVWLVLVSGAVGGSSDGEPSAEVRVVHGEQTRDRFGHQTLGAEDNEAGFLSFFVVRDVEEEQRVHVELAADGERAVLRDLRLVAARLPEGADVHYLDNAERSERTGRDIVVDALDIEPREPGEYVILAKANISEDPGNITARTWVTGVDKEPHPNAPSGVGYVNARAADAPMFVAFQEYVGEPGTVSLRGTSSGVGERDGWWNENFRYRRPLTISEGTPGGTAVAFSFPHATAVREGQSSSDGDDVRVVFAGNNGGEQVARVLDPQSSWNADASRIWFRTEADRPAVGTYFVYYGNDSAQAPPDDPHDVFTHFDDFTTLDGWTTARGMPSVDGSGRALIPGQTVIRSVVELPVAQSHVFEARLRFASSAPDGAAAYWMLGTSDVLTGVDGGRVAYFGHQNQQHVVGEGAQPPFGWEPTTPTDFHRYGIVYGGGQLRFSQDDDPIHEAQPTLTPTNVFMTVENGQQDALVLDWVRVRRAVQPEPTVMLGSPEGAEGLAASTWSYRRLLAFRADAFERVQSSVMPNLVTTTSTFTEIVQTLEIEAAVAQSEYLVIQSARIGGASSDTAAKSGVLLADGEVVMQTRHRINRTDTQNDGYHHSVAAAYRRRTSAPMIFANGVASPDEIRVSIAESSILVLRYPPR